MKVEMVSDGLKVAPPVAVSAASMAGMPLSDVAYLLTAIYTACMLIHFIATKWLIPLHRRSVRRKRHNLKGFRK
jgi:hypothetical protein